MEWIMTFHIQLGMKNHPNWRTHSMIFQRSRWLNHQPNYVIPVIPWLSILNHIKAILICYTPTRLWMGWCFIVPGGGREFIGRRRSWGFTAEIMRFIAPLFKLLLCGTMVHWIWWFADRLVERKNVISIEDGPQWCECWFINQNKTPINYIIIQDGAPQWCLLVDKPL